MEALIHDLKFAVRMMAVRPAFTAVAILSLALGIGANAAIFSVINSLLLKSLPYADAGRLVLIWGTQVEGTAIRDSRNQVSATDIADCRAHNSVFEDVTTYGNWSATFTGLGEPERVNGMQVGDGYFSIMRGSPLLGRVFTPEEQTEGKDRVLVIGYGLWKRKFEGDPAVIGRNLSLGGQPYTVVGVMAQSFAPLPPSLIDYRAEFYRPVAEKYDNQDRSSRHLRAIGRLKPGIKLEQAQVEMSGLAARLEKDHPATNTDYGFRLVTIGDDTVGGLRLSLLLMAAAVAFVLLIACANVANMFLARATDQQRETAIRAALGATRWRVARQLLTESLLLGVAGGGFGLALAWCGTRSIVALGSQAFPQVQHVGLDRRVVAFTAAVSLLTGVIFWLAPALGASRLDLNSVLKEAGRSVGGPGQNRTRAGLIVAEVGMALILLTLAGLLIKSLVRLRNVDPGFNPEKLLTVDISLPSSRFPDGPSQASFFRRLGEQIESAPGVESGGFVSILPLGKNFDGRGLAIEDHPKPRGQEISADLYVVTPGYLKSVGIRLLRGRLLERRDSQSAAPAALINETMARELWSGRDPIGKRVRFPGREGDMPVWRSIVGVVSDVKQYGLDKQANMQFYLPEDQYPVGSGSVVVHAKTDPAALTATVRSSVHELDPDLALYDIATMDQLLSDSMSLRRFSMILLGIFAAIALILAAIGIYSVVSYSVTQRTHEIGVRMALGASSTRVIGLVLREGMLAAGIGAGAGLVGSVFLTHFIASLLFGVSPTDSATYIAIIAVMFAVSGLACYVPARRATRTDPMVALRCQ
ncbi:MAG TPA: ABC transporter permease [Blastocatellia bacterium]|nr:ABC transporter permease [Blastocatellia bacterium]